MMAVYLEIKELLDKKENMFPKEIILNPETRTILNNEFTIKGNPPRDIISAYGIPIKTRKNGKRIRILNHIKFGVTSNG